MFYRKVVPLNFGFGSLENEQNFLSNQKAGKLMHAIRNKVFIFEVNQMMDYGQRLMVAQLELDIFMVRINTHQKRRCMGKRSLLL